MSLELDYVKKYYPVLTLVRELQDGRGYSTGVVRPEWNRDQKTRCPIHDDGEPSAKAYVSTNSLYCWVCGRAWDVPGLYAAAHGVGVGQAVRVLLSRLGIARESLEAGRGLSEVVKALDDSRTPTPVYTDGSMRAYRASVHEWALAGIATYPHLSYVLDECECPSDTDPESCVARLRVLVQWVLALYAPAPGYPGPYLEGPVAEEPVVRSLVGV